jgi:hypothetical protein
MTLFCDTRINYTNSMTLAEKSNRGNEPGRCALYDNVELWQLASVLIGCSGEPTGCFAISEAPVFQRAEFARTDQSRVAAPNQHIIMIDKGPLLATLRKTTGRQFGARPMRGYLCETSKMASLHL